MTRDRRILVKNVGIISMDDAIGVIDRGMVFVEGARIRAVGAELGPIEEVDETIDAPGFILLPGFVNAHMHSWQTALRGIASNWTLSEYFRWVHAGLATKFTPADIAIGTYAGAMNQLNAGTTTLVDWCHNNPTPDHTDAAIDGLERSGIRAAFFHGSPKPDPKPGERPFWEVEHPREEMERLLSQSRFGADSLLSLGMAILGPHYSTLEVAIADFVLARDLQLTASMHQGGGAPRALGGWDVLEERGLLGPLINIVHGNDLDDERLDRFVGHGVSFSVTPENEMTQGHGHPIIGRLRDRGVAPSIGVDLESGLSGEMYIAARIALGHQRSLDNAAFRSAAAPSAAPIPSTSTISTMQALRWITVEGARMIGKLDRIGSITPGKDADLVLIDARLPNMQPVHDLINSALMQTTLSNIDSVMVAGRWRKRGGALLDDAGEGLDPTAWLDPLRASGARLADEVGLPSRLRHGASQVAAP